MSPDERVALIREKIERATRHLQELESARDQFFDPHPYQIESKRDPSTGFDVFTVTNIKTPPHEIGLIAGDLIHNLRSSLDHLAYQLVLTNKQKPTKQTAFPIFDDEATYRSGRASRVRGMDPTAIAAIDAVKPYRDGSNQLWLLHYLDIADKHHTLLVTLVSVTEMVMQMPNLWWAGSKVPAGGVPRFSLPHFQKPLKNGDIFFTCEPGVEENVNFAFDVALLEPDLIEGRPLIKSLGLLVDFTDRLIDSFRPYLR